MTFKWFNVKRGDEIALLICRAASFAALLGLFAFILMGLVSMLHGSAVYVGWGGIFFKDVSAPDHGKAISEIVGSLEYFLLAPLPYLILRTVGNYCKDLMDSPDGRAKDETMRALLAVKCLIGGLLIAILSTNLLTIFLASTSSGEFPTVKVLAGCAVICVLTLYIFVLEHFAHKARNGDKS
jgi:hypothetical protein